jgi:hypothetical protein
MQGYNCQDAAADDRLMLGGYACQDTGDVLHARQLARVAEKGAAVVAAGHAADPAMLRACHGRLCTLPATGKNSPDHDAAACHHAMTSQIGVLVEDAGYHSEANLTAPGPDRLIADGKTSDLARRRPPARRRHHRRGQHAQAGHPRGPRRLQAPRARRREPARQPQGPRRPAPLQPPRPAQRHKRIPVRRPCPQPPAAGRHQLNPAHSCPATPARNTHQNRHTVPPPGTHPEPRPRNRFTPTAPQKLQQTPSGSKIYNNWVLTFFWELPLDKVTLGDLLATENPLVLENLPPQ